MKDGIPLPDPTARTAVDGIDNEPQQPDRFERIFRFMIRVGVYANIAGAIAHTLTGDWWQAVRFATSAGTGGIILHYQKRWLHERAMRRSHR